MLKRGRTSLWIISIIIFLIIIRLLNKAQQPLNLIYPPTPAITSINTKQLNRYYLFSNLTNLKVPVTPGKYINITKSINYENGISTKENLSSVLYLSSIVGSNNSLYEETSLSSTSQTSLSSKDSKVNKFLYHNKEVNKIY